ncbi:MAG TPA: transposase [Thiobacillus sp.]
MSVATPALPVRAERLWAALLAATLMNLPLGSVYAFSVLLRPIEQELAIPRSALSLVFGLATVGFTAGSVGAAFQNRAALFKLLFDAASQTLLEFGAQRLDVQLGITAVLHTWSQTLGDHYHLHGIVTGGGVARDQSRWVASAPHYLFPVRALSRMFRGKYLAGVNALFIATKLEFHGALEALAAPVKFAALLRAASKTEWVVYAKRPFAGPQQVLAYLSRYTHRVAISPRRLLVSDGQSVTFAYKDYADASRRKTMTLGTAEFVRRFCLHVLPERFVKIRHYGLLGNRGKQERLARARALLGVAPPPDALPLPELLRTPATQASPRCCPFCQRPGLVKVGEVPPGRVARLDSS